MGTEKRKLTEEDKLKEVENLPLVDQIHVLENKNKKLKLDSNATYSQEKQLLLEYYAESIQRKVVPRKDECERYLKKVTNKIIINWSQMKEIIAREVIKVRMKDPRFRRPVNFHTFRRDNFSGRF